MSEGMSDDALEDLLEQDATPATPTKVYLPYPKRFSASSAAQLMACPAAGNLDVAIPNWEEPERFEGRGAKNKGHVFHNWLSEIILFSYETGIDPRTGKPRVHKNSAKDLLAFGSVLTYIGELWSTRRFKVLSEVSIMATWLDKPEKTTVDLVLYTQDEIHVLDLKAGKIPVEVVENEQLMFYGASFGELAPKAKEIVLHILQPWANGNNSWAVSTVRMAQFMQEARAAQAKVLARDTTFGPSEHCAFCPANPHSRSEKGRPLCPAQMQLLYPQPLDEDEILNL